MGDAVDFHLSITLKHLDLFIRKSSSCTAIESFERAPLLGAT
jgi:hypothetical protein